MSKHIQYIFAASVFLFVIVSCQKETPPPSGSDGRDRFVGTWNCDEFSSQSGNNPTFVVFINKSTADPDQVTLGNFYALGNQYSALATAVSDSLYIYPQIVAGNTVQGSGKLQNTNTIQMTYTVYDGSNTDNVTATFTK